MHFAFLGDYDPRAPECHCEPLLRCGPPGTSVPALAAVLLTLS
jgi:hypothetical protein